MANKQVKRPAKRVYELEVVYLDPKTLQLAPWNPAEHTERGLNAVDESIKEFGWVEPIVVWHGFVINGNARLKTALSRMDDRIPVVVRDDLSEDQARAYTLVSRRIPQMMIDDEQKIYELARSIPKGKLTPFYTEDELEEKRNFLESILRTRSGQVREDLEDAVEKKRAPESMVLTLSVPMDLWRVAGDTLEEWFKDRVEEHPGLVYAKRKKGG